MWTRRWLLAVVDGKDQFYCSNYCGALLLDCRNTPKFKLIDASEPALEK